MCLTTQNTRTVAFGPVSTGKPGPCKPGIFPAIKDWSSDRIARWSICKWCGFRSSFTCWSGILNPSIIRCVAVENPRFASEFECYLVATQQILIGVQIANPGVKELLTLHLLRTDHVMICLELEDLIEAKIVGTTNWNHSPVGTKPKAHRSMSGPGNNPALVRQCAWRVLTGTGVSVPVPTRTEAG